MPESAPTDPVPSPARLRLYPESEFASLLYHTVPESAPTDPVPSPARLRLYPESEFASLPDHTVPEVRRSDLAGCVLQLRALGVTNVVRFALPTPPPSGAVLAACELLFALGAISMDGGLTERGRAMAEMPLPPTHARMVLAAGARWRGGGGGCFKIAKLAGHKLNRVFVFA